MNTNERDWHLNKNVSVSVIVLLLINIGSGAWFMSGLSSDVAVLQAMPNLNERVVKLEALSSEHGRLLQRLAVTLDKLDLTLDAVAKEQAKRTPLVYKKEK